MTEEEAYELLATHRMLEDKERPGHFSCGATLCPHQYNAMTSHNWQAHRRHWAKLIADATTIRRPVAKCDIWQDGLCFCTKECAN